ncbi:hypothetical protein L7F22_058192 [Adiantum nelumboides]|nr:hypothetical protein [Adiantum nelumboides]
MKTRQQNIPSEYEESEEAERLDSESSDDSEYAPASEENTSEDHDQANEDSPSSSRGAGATDLLSNIVTPDKLGAMLLTFPKLNNKILNAEHLGRAMGIKNMPIPLPASKTYSRLTPRETADACDELLSDSHPDFQRHQKIFHILHYYFLMRVPVVNSLSLPSPRLYDMFFCLCHSLPYPFHVTMFKAIQNRTKRFKTQRKGKAKKFHCYAAPIMQWMAQLISELDTPGSSQSPAIEKGKRPLSGRGVQTRGGHSKRTKVSRDSAAYLSSLPFSQSHDTGSFRTQTSSHISPTHITTATGPTMVSSAPQPTPQMISPIGIVGPAPSPIVHHTGLTAATTISIKPSTSMPTPRTSAPQGITHFMSRADKLLQMERSATLSIADAINTIHGAQKMHAVTYESMYEELLDTHQRVYDRDVEKAALFHRNRILNRQVKDLKEVISSLNLQLREAQEQLQQKSVVTTMVCERCAQMELTVTNPTPVATISLPTQGIPTTYSGGVSLASHTLTGSHEQTEVVTSMPLPPHGVFTCPLPGRPYVGASTYAPSMPPTPFVSSSAPIQPNPTIYSSHFGTLPQYNMQFAYTSSFAISFPSPRLFFRFSPAKPCSVLISFWYSLRKWPKESYTREDMKARAKKVLWNDEEVELLRQSWSAYRSSIQTRTTIYEEFAAVQHVIERCPHLFGQGVTCKQFLHAYAVVNSRAWGIDEGNTVGLVPFVDFLNHSTECQSFLSFDKDYKYAEVLADKGYSCGEQVLILTF